MNFQLAVNDLWQNAENANILSKAHHVSPRARKFTFTATPMAVLCYLSSDIFQPIWVFYRTGADSFCMTAHIIHSSSLNAIQYRGRTGSFRSITTLRNRHRTGYPTLSRRRFRLPIHPVFCRVGTMKEPEMKRRRK